LDADLAREKRKEELRVEFAKLASEFSRFAKDTSAQSKTTLFGFVLEEVEAFGKTLAGKDSAITTRAANTKVAYDKVFHEMTELKVDRNPYTTLTPADLEKSQNELAQALKDRQAKYAAELAKQRDDDAKCRALAACIDPFMHDLATHKNELTTTKASEEDQLKLCKQRVEEAKGFEAKVAELKTLQAAVDAAGVLYNRHTLNNALDAEVVSGQYLSFLQAKQKQLEEEIEHKLTRGVSKEQYAEIQQQWTQFDKDKSGTLDRHEFKALLYSLGEEKGSQEVIAIMEKVGEGKGKECRIKYNGFKEFMITQLGDTETKEEIINGFRLINRGSETIKDDLITQVMENEELAFIKSTHASGDYSAWAETVFAR